MRATAIGEFAHPIQISLGAAPYAANVQMMNLPSNAVIVGQNNQTGNKTIVIGNGQITIGGTPIT